MARKLTSNTGNKLTLGVGTLGTLLDGASKIAIHGHLRFDSLSGGSGNPFALGALTGANVNFISLGLIGTTGTARVVARALAADAAQQITSVERLQGPWYSCGVLIDYGNSTISLYLNGKLNKTIAATFGASAFTFSATGLTAGDAIGANNSSPSAANQWDGDISKMAIWKFGANDAGLSAGEFRALAEGMDAANVQNGNLVTYLRLNNQTLAGPEPDYKGAVVGTITGYVPMVADPVFPRPRSFLVNQATVFSISRILTGAAVNRAATY